MLEAILDELVNKKFVLDTSIIIDGEITKMLESGIIQDGSEIIIPLAVLDELQSQASTNKEHGFVGLSEIKRIREQSRNFKEFIIIAVVFSAFVFIFAKNRFNRIKERN